MNGDDIFVHVYCLQIERAFTESMPIESKNSNGTVHALAPILYQPTEATTHVCGLFGSRRRDFGETVGVGDYFAKGCAHLLYPLRIGVDRRLNPKRCIVDALAHG